MTKSRGSPRIASVAVVLGCCVLSGFGLTRPATLSQPQNRERTDAASQRAAARIRALQQEAERLASQESALLVQLRKLEIQRQLKLEALAEVQRDQATTERALADSARRAETLRQTVQIERPEIEARLVQVYKLGQAGFWRLLFDVDDLRSLGRAYRTASALMKIDRDRVLGHQRTLEALARERRDLEARATKLAALRDQAAKARTALEKAVASQTQLVASIDARRDLTAQMISELQNAQQRLQVSLNQLGSGASAGLPLRPFQGVLPWPARGPVAVRFGGGQSSSRIDTAGARNGIEITVTQSQLVRAIHEGTVAFADQFTGYANLVILEHSDRAYSLYGHLASLQVSKGERIEAQAPLGMSGRNPSGNPAVYFELRVDGKPVDPLQWLSRGSADKGPAPRQP
jgi:septal ring factor EnvC (AmiA/AmiB activator)